VVGAIQVVNASLSVAGGAALSAIAPASTRDLAGVTLDGSISAQGSIGALNVSGPGSSFNSNEGPFVVGNTGTGILTISGGATVASTSTLGVFVGQSLGATGVVTVTDPTSTFLMKAALSVGGNTWVGPNLNYGGSGTVSVLNGATLGVLGTPVVSGGVTIIAGAVMTLGAVPATGGTVQGAGFLTLDAASHVEIGGDGSLSPAGTLLVDANNTLNGYGQVDGPIEAFGSIDASSGYLQLGTVSSSNTLGIEAGATLGLDALSFGEVKFNALQGTLRLSDLAAFAGSIAMGNFGGTINLPGVEPSQASFSGSVLSVDSGGVVSSATLTGLPAAPVSIISDDGAGGTNVVIACFTAGTRILTPEGERAVETLRPDDFVVALSGRGPAARRVTWVGARRLDIGRHASPWLVAPVRIRAGALADGVPHRDLLLSPDHAVLLRDTAGEALVPAHSFVNGASIAQERHTGIVSYWHVELSAHDLVLAEGLPVESFLDTGNRAAFAPAGEAVFDLHPDFSPRRWDEAACAPLLLGGRRVAAARAGLLARARGMGYALGRDAGLVVEHDGTALVPARLPDGTLRMRLPSGGSRSIRLRSRHAVPWLLNPGIDDRRCLGVAVEAVALDGIPVALEAGVFGEGFFPVEHDGAGAWRWTGGDATLLLPVGVSELTLRLRDFWLRYWTLTAA
jgi:T5SS/PEP-CTERM-associated repeat protein